MSLTLLDIEKARERIGKYLSPTPLKRYTELEEELHFNGKIFLKLDSEQPTGSFKVRGAFNVLLQLSQDERKKGVITRSRGNFAQAVAYAAQKLNIKATIIIPKNAPKTKIEGTKKYKAQIQFSDPTQADADAIVQKIVNEKGFIPLHPYNDYRTMAGQGTAALEILQQCEKVDSFFCSIGGGGLLCGCATAFKEHQSQITIYGVEPEGAADYHASRLSKKLEIWDNVNTIADGLRAPSVGELNFPILNQYVDHVLTVSEAEIKAAMRLLYDTLKMVSEPSGAVSLAGFLKIHSQIKGNVVIHISGKNVDLELFHQWISE